MPTAQQPLALDLDSPLAFPALQSPLPFLRRHQTLPPSRNLSSSLLTVEYSPSVDVADMKYLPLLGSALVAFPGVESARSSIWLAIDLLGFQFFDSSFGHIPRWICPLRTLPGELLIAVVWLCGCRHDPSDLPFQVIRKPKRDDTPQTTRLSM